MTLGYALIMIVIAVVAGVLSIIISDNIRGYTNLTTLKRLFSLFKTKHPLENNHIIETDKDVYTVQSPHQNNDSVKYKFSNGNSMSFSLKSVRRRYTKKEDFVNEMRKSNQHLIDEGTVSDDSLSSILEAVWNKAFAK